MTGYAKFMKDLVMKNKPVSYKPEDNLHHCSTIYMRSLVNKKANPGAFTIPCTIGSVEFAKVLCDLGASINLIPLVVFKRMGLGNPILTIIQLVMVDRSVKQPVGIIHDVLVNMANFILLVDFVVLDCEFNFKVPVISSRPFLDTGRVVVDIELNDLKFKSKDKEARLKIHSSMTQQKKMSVFSILDVFYEDGKEVAAWCHEKVFVVKIT
ncbi:uncharacterized protein LOC124897944 [Capsicum annuum]|uniref:uncharacterized protein LOC124897944 n=1 Tax=Capsicum annuum TaxID=4072 RepID=UPI001FB1306F|nr:uncharacterized protein LOC124897944 [Capsicum annuum]